MVKKDSFGNIWNPYRAGFSDLVHFEVDDPQNVQALVGNNDEFTLKLKNDAPEGSSEFEVAESTIRFFGLEEIYQSHKQFVRELLHKKHAYNEAYLRQLQDIFQKAGVGMADANLILYGFEMDKDRIGERILGKRLYPESNRSFSGVTAVNSPLPASSRIQPAGISKGYPCLLA